MLGYNLYRTWYVDNIMKNNTVSIMIKIYSTNYNSV